ncbi:MAG: T9SS type A sorting domain-containing protein [Chitinophagales bacterium]|nr:T9SS type A sorting domain-containing protein [Chitinophagales bacterium]
MNNLIRWYQYLLLTFAIWSITFGTIAAQSDGDPAGMSFDEAYTALIEAGYAECFATVDFAEDATAQDLYNYILLSGCQPNGGGFPGDTIGWGGEWTLEDEIEWLSASYPECFADAPEFTDFEQLYEYLYTCPAYIDANTWDLNDEIEWLLTYYPECFADAPEFTTIEELYDYLNENCEQWIDDMTWTVEEEVEWLSASYPECFADAPEFASFEELYNYLYNNCPSYYSPIDTLFPLPWDSLGDGGTDPTITPEELVEQLIAAGYGECFVGAPEFADIDAVYDYLFNHCGGGMPGDTVITYPDDEWSVEDEIEYLISIGLGTCLEGAPEFANFEELYSYLNSCPDYIDYITWDINDEIEWLTSAGYGDCLEGTTFTSIEELYAYLNENCEQWIDDMTWDLEDDIEWIISSGYGDCIEGLTFANSEELYAYLYENCEQWIDDMTWDLEDELAWLAESGYADCIAGQTFASIEELYAFLNAECEQWIDDTTWDVSEAIEWVGAAGYGDCLVGAPEFATVEDLYAYLGENCEQWIDDMTWTVDEEIEWLISMGYGDCLTDAPAFTNIEELYTYLYENCEAFTSGGYDYPVEIPECMLAMPADITTLQGYLDYVAANCGAEFLAGIPACYFEAPDFATDEEFFAWISENCTEGLAPMTDDQNSVMQTYYFATNGMPEGNPSQVNSATNIAIGLAPNPAAEYVTVQSPDPIAQCHIFDLNGKQIAAANNIQQTQINIPLDGVAKGIYIVKVLTTNGKVGIQKLTVAF